VTCTVYEISPPIKTPEHLRTDPALAAAADHAYATSRSGPRTAIPSSIIYLPYSHMVPPSTLAALSASLTQTSPSTTNDPRKAILAARLNPSTVLGQIEFNFDTSNYSPYFQSIPGKSYATMLQMLQYPFSTGSIHIPAMRPGSRTPTAAADNPVIDPRYYAGPGGDIDFAMMVAAQKLGHRICSTAPLSSIIVARAHPPPPPIPLSPSPSPSPAPSPVNPTSPSSTSSTASNQAAEDDEDFTPFVRANTVTDWHPVGTCSMGGRAGIKHGVVDARLRVYGARGLRVCDASVMPLQVGAHIQATVYAVAEKGAGMVGEDWERRA